MNKNRPIKTVSLQSLSSGMAGESKFLPRFEIGKKRLEDVFGFEVKVAKHALAGSEFIKNNPKARAVDLMNALKNPNVDAIIANIGGLDSHLIVQFLDLGRIKKADKPVIGFSDTTSIHLVFHNLGVQTFYGPSVLDGFAENVKMHPYTIEHFQTMVLGEGKITVKSADMWTSEYLEWSNRAFDGVARKLVKEQHGHMYFANGAHQIEGHLLGGCLDSIMGIKDEPFFPKLSAWKNAIIFLETAEDKMPPHEFEAGIKMLKKEIDVCAGLIFGKPKDEAYFAEYLAILKTHVKKPFVFNLNFGHTAPIMTLPYGGKCVIDFDKKVMTIARDNN